MAEQLLTRRSEAPRVTLKVQRVANPSATSPWPRRLLLLLAVAVGGAILGQLGSTVLSRMLQANGANGNSSIVTRAMSLAERQAEIEGLLLSRDSSAALLLIDDALAHFPNDPQLLALRRRTEDELRNRFRFQSFELLVAKRNYAAALALFDEISADSPYRHRAAQELPVLRARYVAEQIEAAQLAAKLGQCAEARLLASRVQAIDPAHAGVRAIESSCGADSTSSRKP